MTTTAVDKRRVILDAAVAVFARQGFHTCRVADIADEAGVAYGLVYHYFSSKEEILDTLFLDRWDVMLAVDVLDDRPGDEVDAELARDLAGPGHAAAVERLRGGGHLLGGPEHAPLLRQDDELGAPPGRGPHETIGGGEVAVRVLGRIQLNCPGAQRILLSR